MEKEMKQLKKTNQELLTKLNQKENSSSNNQQNVALTFNSITITSPLNLDRKYYCFYNRLITDKLLHKRVDSDKSYKSEINDKISKFKGKVLKSKQNSDE